jgi:hypothetical protein
MLRHCSNNNSFPKYLHKGKRNATNYIMTSGGTVWRWPFRLLFGKDSFRISAEAPAAMRFLRGLRQSLRDSTTHYSKYTWFPIFWNPELIYHRNIRSYSLHAESLVKITHKCHKNIWNVTDCHDNDMNDGIRKVIHIKFCVCFLSTLGLPYTIFMQRLYLKQLQYRTTRNSFCVSVYFESQNVIINAR